VELNNDKLSSGERAEMRDLLTTGARRMKAARARRTQLASVAAAVVLVAAVVTGVSFAALNPIDRVAEPVETTNTPTPTPTQTPTPTPTPTATPDPVVVPSIALDGDCGRVLSDAEASEILGTLAEAAAPPNVARSSPLGGVSCNWHVAGTSIPPLQLSVFPIDVVPASVAEVSGQVPECDPASGDECVYAERFGGAWVLASGGLSEQMVRAVEIVGQRAAAQPGSRPEGADNGPVLPGCETLRTVVADVLGRADLVVPYAGDAAPRSMWWSIMEANQLVSWCGIMGDPQEGVTELISVQQSRGSGDISQDVLGSMSAVAITLPSGRTAWYSLGVDSDSSPAVIASVGNSVVVVSSRFLEQADLVAVFEAIAPAG
jgi:hypothetical protein